MRQDLWALQGHGQCDPPQTPAQVLVSNIVCHIICNIAIIRYHTSISQKKYDMTVRGRMRFFYKYLDWRLRRVALAMPLERRQVLPHDSRPSLMVCTELSQS